MAGFVGAYIFPRSRNLVSMTIEHAALLAKLPLVSLEEIGATAS